MQIDRVIPPPFITPTPLEPKKRTWLKVFGVLLLVLAVLVGVTLKLPLVLTLMFPRDAKLLDNSNVYLTTVSVPNKENAYFVLAKVDEKSLYVPEKYPTFDLEYTNYAKPVVWNQQLVDTVLQRNSAALALFSIAAEKDYFQYPAYADPAKIDVNTEFYSMGSLRRLARLQSVKAVSLARHGQTTEALVEAVKLERFGHTMLGGHNSLLGGLVAIAVQRLGSETIREVLRSSTVSKGALLNTLTSLKGLNDNAEGYKNMFRFDYTNTFNSIDKIVNKEVQDQLEQMVKTGEANAAWARYAQYGYYYKPNQTKNLYTRLYETEINAVGKTCELGELPEITNNAVRTSWKLVFTENAVGKLLFSVTRLSLGSVLTKQCENDLVFNVAKAELGLRLYKIDHGALPASLDKISPDYMERVPEDPFGHEPLRYDAKKKILYSKGKSGQDRGGNEGEDWSKMENPTFQLGF